MTRTSRTWRVPKETEHEHQVALFRWSELQSSKWPGLALLMAIPNGGARHIAVARKLKAEGVRAGVPDIFLPVPMIHTAANVANQTIYREWHGLWIELKLKGNKPTPTQAWWHERLEEHGYKVVVAYGWIEAKDAIVDYLEGKE